MTIATTIYEIEKADETIRVEVPSDWKVTFGPVAVGGNQKRYANGEYGSMALRFYESETKQRAIFTGVKSFRDISLPTVRKVMVTQGQDEYTYDQLGNRQLVKRAAKQVYWEPLNGPVDESVHDNPVIADQSEGDADESEA